MKLKLLSIAIGLTGILSAQNIGINSTGATPHASAILDIDASPGNNKGLLVPRIQLQATNLAAPVITPAISLLVFNTATASTGSTAVTPGYYYWDGSKWIRLQAANAGSSSTSWDIFGNAGTTAGVNFLGTTDDVDLIFKRSNVQAGLLNNVSHNTAFGVNSFSVNVGGYGNVAIGHSSLLSNTAGNGNSALGQLALYSNTIGQFNVAIGSEALQFNTIGEQNTAVGTAALKSNISGIYNTAQGFQALANNTTGSSNTALGFKALFTSTATNGNVAIGAHSSYSNTTGANNVSIGNLALYSNTIGNNNVAIGNSSLYDNTTGGENIAIGRLALNLNLTGQGNTAIGDACMQNNKTGNYNTANGKYSLLANTTGNGNTAMGQSSLLSNTIGEQNTAIGAGVLATNTSGNYNTAVGVFSMGNNTTGSSNTAMGETSLQFNTIGIRNTAVGVGSSNENTTGNLNASFGAFSLRKNTTGNFNTAIGTSALDTNLTGSYNTASGHASLAGNRTGNYNTAIGYAAGQYSVNETGAQNTFLGAYADVTADGFTKATAIGYNAKVGQSNALILGGAGIDAVDVGIGTATPTAKLHLNQGNLKITNNFYSLLEQYSYSSAIDHPAVIGYKARGTEALPSYPLSGDILGAFIGRDAIDGASGANYGGSDIYYYTTENYSAANKGSKIVFNTTPNGFNNKVERMVINHDGNVGIGVPAPTQKLEVNGNVKATSFIATTAGVGSYKYNTVSNMTVPDYVFESYYDKNTTSNPTYKLMPLNEVERFIKTNKHLPRVPSREELQKENGINLQGIAMVNLEKTEENTLYIIELKKQIEQQQYQLKEQKLQTEQQQKTAKEQQVQIDSLKRENIEMKKNYEVILELLKK